jgi:peptidoglycan hydrolase-like amidase
LRWLCASILYLSLALVAQPQARPRSVRIGVLGIFHPRVLTIAPEETGELLVLAADRQIFLLPRSACSLLNVRSSGGTLLLDCGGKEFRARKISASGRNQQPVGFFLGVPGKLKRRYEGILELKARDGELIPVVAMDLETAVASVVLAETAPGTPLEALKAQAVVSRSYLVAGGSRHSDFDFCDLTHCQFLRESPAADSPAAAAAAATQNIVLTFDRKPIAAMFTPSCGGHTRTPQEIHMPPSAYPYFSVICDSCYKGPIRWTRKISSEDAALLFLRGENGRLAIGRKLGWDAVPSNNFTAREQNSEVILHGTGKGHGIGLCQRGARDLAAGGADFHEILAHYFPNTKLEQVPSAW